MKEVQIDKDIPIPEEIHKLAEIEPNIVDNIDIAKVVEALPESAVNQLLAMREAENDLLKAKLEIAELKLKLAAQTSPSVAPETVPVGRPLPEPAAIPAGLPPMPNIDPLLGDKTPAIVEWFRDHWPEEFDVRYKGRKTHLKAKLSSRGGVDMDDDDREEAKAPTFQPSAADGSIDTSPRLY